MKHVDLIHRRMARGGHGLPTVSLGPPYPTLLHPAGGPPLKRPYGLFMGDPLVTPRRTPMTATALWAAVSLLSDRGVKKSKTKLPYISNYSPELGIHLCTSQK
jgi:hypothetical protein